MSDPRHGFRICWSLIAVLFVSYLWLPAVAEVQAAMLPGLRSEALVVDDANGVPHICSGSDRDTYFMQGYIHARDRFFQMDTLRRTFSGNLAELVGPAALGSDVQFRNLGLRRAAEASLAGYREAGLTDTLEMLDAYARGINVYLSSQPLPAEYRPLEITRAAPWGPVDSLVITKGLAFGLSFDLIDIDLTIQSAAYNAAGAALGFDGLALLFEDVSRPAPFDPTVSIPQGSIPQPPPAAEGPEGTRPNKLQAPNPRAVELAERYRERAMQVPQLARAFEHRGVDRGSNWWMVSAERSATGHPILANDPHLGLDTPSIFYEAHLVSSEVAGCGFEAGEGMVFGPETERVESEAADKGQGGGLNVNGVSFPGAPGVVLGCNTEICWGATTNPMDVTDVYLEVLVIDPNLGLPTHTIFEGQPEPLVPRLETFLVNQIGDLQNDNLVDAGLGPLEGGLTLLVPRRNNGPIIQIDTSQIPVVGLSVQYTGWGPTFELEAFRRWQRTSDLDEFVDALQFFDVGSQNWAYADVAGNIAYFTSAEMPIREDLQNLGFPDGGVPPFLIRDGTHTLAHEWLPVTNPQPRQTLPWEILSFDEMPQVVNPESGFIINANNDPVGTTVDNDPLNQARAGGGIFYLSPGYADGLRQGRIARMMEALLAEGNKATADDLKEMQANNQLLDAELVAPFVATAFANATAPDAPLELQVLAADAGVAEAVTRLAAWDYSSPTGIPEGYDPGDDPNNLPAPSNGEIANSVAATIWSVFRGQLTRNVVDAALTVRGLGDFLPGSGRAYSAVAHLLMTFDDGQGFGASGVDFFPAPDGWTREQARDFHVLLNLKAALELLAGDDFAVAFGNSTDQNDYRWGYLHRIVFDHPLGGPFSVPPAGGFQDLAPGLPGIARSGGFGAVDASSHSARADDADDFMFGSGPARRFVGVMDPDGIEADEIIPGGQSGQVTSPNYASQLGRWLTNDYHSLLLTSDDVGDAAVSQQAFTPNCVPGPTTLCLQERRFKVTATWSEEQGGGHATVVPGASELSANFYFFDPENWEMLVKVLDGCAINGHFWVYASAATDLEWELTVEDTDNGEIWSTSNPLGNRSPAVTETTAFATCP